MPRPRKEPGPRKIEKSQKGRVWWKPGEDHPLDKLDDELADLRDQLPTELEALLLAAHQTEQQLQALRQLEQDDDPAEAFTAADRLASRVVIERFHNRKHEHHLRTLFAIQRRKRLMGRLKAIRAALDLANGLLEEEETLSEEFLATWREKVEEPFPAPEQEQEEEQPPLTTEERRLKHLNEPLTAIVGSVEQSRQLLRDFEKRLPELRSGLTTGNGWIEVFYVPKRRFKKEIIAYATAWATSCKRGTPVSAEREQAIDPRVAALIQSGAESFPPELRDQVYDIVEVGPYAKYRWREDGRTYSISLGLEDDYPEYPFVPQGF